MSNTTHCPQGHLLRIRPDSEGKKVKCPKCQVIFVVPRAGADEFVEVEPLPPEAPKSRASPQADDELVSVEPILEMPARGQRARDVFDDDYDDARAPRRHRERDDDYDDDRPRKKHRDEDAGRPRRKWGNWFMVGVGIRVQMISTGVLLGAAGIGLIGLLVLLICLLMSRPPEWLGKPSIIMGGIGAVAFFAAAIPAIIAHILCLFSPSKRGAMAWAIVVLSVGCISSVLRVIWILLPAANLFSALSGQRQDDLDALVGLFTSTFHVPLVLIGGGSRVGPGSIAGTTLVSSLVLLVMYAEYVLLPVYMRRMARALQDRSSAREAVVSVIFAAAGVGLKLVGVLVFFIGLPSVRGPGGAKAVLIIASILMLFAHASFTVYALSFLQLCRKTRRTIDKRD